MAFQSASRCRGLGFWRGAALLLVCSIRHTAALAFLTPHPNFQALGISIPSNSGELKGLEIDTLGFEGFIDGFLGELENVFKPVLFAVLIELFGVFDLCQVPSEAGCLFNGNGLGCVDGMRNPLEEIQKAIHGLPQIESIFDEFFFWSYKELLNSHSGVSSFKKLDSLLKLWVRIELLA